jgi:hypothetical protein
MKRTFYKNIYLMMFLNLLGVLNLRWQQMMRLLPVVPGNTLGRISLEGVQWVQKPG